MGLSVTVVGASGYSGGEVLRLLARHPDARIAAAAAERRAGERVAAVHPHLEGVLDLELCSADEALAEPADAVVACLPSGRLSGIAGSIRCDLVVDLSDDHRNSPGWVYGLSEHRRAEIAGAPRVANPGCYPTAALLCLVPLARSGAVEGPVVIAALSGTSGAGRAPEDRLLFTNLDGGAAAYGAVAHRHVPEIERGLARLGGMDAVVSFTPHLVPMARGVVVTARATLRRQMTDADALAIVREAYADEPFVDVVTQWPASKAVAGTNRAQVSARVDPRAGMVVCSAAIDNLGKGAAGQAVQNLNIAAGIAETAGLDAVGLWP